MHDVVYDVPMTAMHDSQDIDRNDLAFWFHKLQATGVPVPRTIVVHTDGPIALTTLVEQLERSALSLGGFPVFLRTGHGSAKHDWRDTCCVLEGERLRYHVLRLIEWSESVDMIGLSTQTWVVREMLPLVTAFHAFPGLMPINKERRYFIENGRVLCHHFYWPAAAIYGADCDNWQSLLDALNEETPNETRMLTAMSERVSRAFDGAWSLDWAATTDGRWLAIDMADAARSWHAEDCPNSPARHLPRVRSEADRDALAAAILVDRTAQGGSLS